MKIVLLEPGRVTAETLNQLYLNQHLIELADGSRTLVEQAAQVVHQAAQAERPVYGVNTGFGKLSNIKIEAEKTQELQRNLILSHCSGVGEDTPDRVVRLMMLLKLLSLARGASGVRWSVIELLVNMYNHKVSPLVPVQGSVGASGDLAPLAHMAAAMMGEGEVLLNGQTISASDALSSLGLSPIVLEAKEGLALINGTQFSCAYALASLFDANLTLSSSVVVSALVTDAIMGSTAPLRAEIHLLRGHQGQIDIAALMSRIMQDSAIRESHREGDTRVQDPYCIRCQPQVAGACLDLMRQALATLVVEANAVTDNPLVISETNDILSGGNFHAEPVAFAADQIAIALAELGSIAQRRVALMVDPALSFDLPPFLTPDPGLNSGFMVAEIAAAGLMSENKHLANPCSTDSTPTSANQEDHVSMAAHGSRRLERMNENLTHIIAIELLCGAQGIECRRPLKTSPLLQNVVARLREQVASLNQDRALSRDIKKVVNFIQRGEVLRACKVAPLLC